MIQNVAFGDNTIALHLGYIYMSLILQMQSSKAQVNVSCNSKNNDVLIVAL